MSKSGAVAYTASPGYLFQTMLSAIQARAHLEPEYSVHLVALADTGDGEQEITDSATVATEHGIVFHRRPMEMLDGLHPMFGRLFLDRVIPDTVDQILYLDGDTQIGGSLTSILTRRVESGRLAAVMDPMTVVRRVHLPLRGQIDRAWNAASLSLPARAGYVNSGVLLFRRADLADLRAGVLQVHRERGHLFTHADQDAINVALQESIDHLPLECNYPGFLLDVECPAQRDARVVHFMSNPRPWHGSYFPWGRQFHQPYVDLAERHPLLAPYWRRPGPTRNLRNHAQQFYKRQSEGKVWRSGRFREFLDLIYPDRLIDDEQRALPGRARPAGRA